MGLSKGGYRAKSLVHNNSSSVVSLILVYLVISGKGVMPLLSHLSVDKASNIAQVVSCVQDFVFLRLRKGRTMTKEQREKCHWIIHANATAGAALAAGMAQIPFLDVPFLMGLEVTMAIELGAVFGEEIDKTIAKGLVASAGGTIGGVAVFKALVGWVPSLGNMINAGTAFTMIETIGWAIAAILNERYGKLPKTLGNESESSKMDGQTGGKTLGNESESSRMGGQKGERFRRLAFRFFGAVIVFVLIAVAFFLFAPYLGGLVWQGLGWFIDFLLHSTVIQFLASVATLLSIGGVIINGMRKFANRKRHKPSSSF